MIIKDTTTGQFVKNLEDKACLNCGKVFHPRLAVIKYCSLDCSRPHLPQSQSTKQPRECMVCHSIFSVRKNSSAKFCAIACYWKWMIGKNMGAENNLWKGGVCSDSQRIRTSIKYKDWVKQVLVRDDFTCVFCGIRGGKLHVDHIVPFALIMRKLRFKHGVEDAYNKAMVYDELWDLGNGRTLCVPCHKSTDTYLKPNL